MDDVNSYHIEIRGKVALEDIAAFSPPGLIVEQAGEANTRLAVRSDQAGMIGLIRQLHGLGFILLSVNVADTRGAA